MKMDQEPKNIQVHVLPHQSIVAKLGCHPVMVRYCWNMVVLWENL